MTDAPAWILDTNILLRMSKSDDPHHPMISGALRALVAQGARLCFTSQILFTLSRPAKSRYSRPLQDRRHPVRLQCGYDRLCAGLCLGSRGGRMTDRKSTRLNS